jgi:hydroxyacylglutathione hydrolase
MAARKILLATLAFLSVGASQVEARPRHLPPAVPDGVMPKPSSRQPYVYRKVNDHFYIIAEIHQPYPRNEANNPVHTQTMGLVIGTKRAAIVDTGLGLADLRKFAQQFTDLPIVAVSTHGHLDHVGADQLFDLSYIAKEDEQTMLSSTRAKRLASYTTMFMPGNAEMIAFAEKNMVADKPFKYEFMKDGDKIDLGGVDLEVVAMPGHSPGSVAILDRRDGVAFTGDSVLFRTVVGTRQNLPNYIKSLDHFTERSKGIDVIINGHQWQPMSQYDVQELRELAQGIADGSIKGVPDKVLKANMYYLRFKRISMRD